MARTSSRKRILSEHTVAPTAQELAVHHKEAVHQQLVRRHRAAAAAPRTLVAAPRVGVSAQTALAATAMALSGHAATGTVDPEQSQLRMISAGNGLVYSVQSDGRLLGFRHLGRATGDATWANGGMGVLLDDSGWQAYETVLAAQDGQLFAVAGDGTMRWYRHTGDLDVNTGQWAAGGGSVIAHGFDAYQRVFGGYDGVIYAVDGAGDLYWFRYLAGDGSTGAQAWAHDGHGVLIKSDLKVYLQLIADQGGVIYGVRQGTGLDWLRYLGDDGQAGPAAWANGGDPVRIGDGWTQESLRDVTADGGVLYSVFVDRATPPGPDHELYWYRLLNWQDIPAAGTPNWASSVGRLVGTGWTTCRTANLQAHTDRPSAAQGEGIGVAVSATVAEYTASVLRLTGPLPGGGTVMWGPTPLSPRLQLLQSGYRRSGTGWTNDVTVPVGAAWPSGFYVVALAGPLGMQRYAPFVVRPAAPAHPVAVMLPMLSHNAYNTWGGHGQYTWDDHPGHKYAPLTRPYANLAVRESGMLDVRFLSDLFLLRWLSANHVDHDCYQDTDLHTDDGWLGNYKALVLGTHPEYWTETMRSRLIAYLAGGGRLIYPGGNGMYDVVDLVDGDLVGQHRDANGNRLPFRERGEPELDVLGVAFGGEYMTFEPYRVVTDHPFLAGTGLTVGDRFGRSGYNGPASGWEMDQSSGADPAVTVLAAGLQAGGGAHMTVTDKGNGGWVFAAGSLSFNGALDDPVVSQILRNVLDAAVR